MGRVRFRGSDWVKSIFLDSNVDPGSTNYVDPGTCLTWQNHGDPRPDGRAAPVGVHNTALHNQ